MARPIHSRRVALGGGTGEIGFIRLDLLGMDFFIATQSADKSQSLRGGSIAVTHNGNECAVHGGLLR